MATQTVEFAAASGLTLVARLFPVGSNTQSGADANATERSNAKGIYTADFIDRPAGDYTLHAFDGADLAAIAGAGGPKLTLALADGTYREEINADVDTAALASELQANGVTVTVVSPFAQNGSLLKIRKGDDYFAADGLPIQIALTGTLPDYTGATAKLRMRTENVTVELTGTISPATSSPRVASFDATAAQTATLAAGPGKYEIEVTLQDGHVTTPIPVPDDPTNNLRVLDSLA